MSRSWLSGIDWKKLAMLLIRGICWIAAVLCVLMLGVALNVEQYRVAAGLAILAIGWYQCTKYLREPK